MFAHFVSTLWHLAVARVSAGSPAGAKPKKTGKGQAGRLTFADAGFSTLYRSLMPHSRCTGLIFALLIVTR